MTTFRKCGIYKITCSLHKNPDGTERPYIGLSCNVKYRWSGHKYALKNNKLENPELKRTWDKYGESTFTFEILEECAEDKLNERECFWIEQCGGVSKCMNCREGGQRGKQSEETRKRISEAHTGKVMSKETKARISAAKRGKPLSPEAIAKRSAAVKGMKRSPETRARMSKAQTGKHHSEETKAKLSAIFTGTKHTPEAIAKISATHKGKPKSAEHKAKIAAAQTGKHHSPETREKMRLAKLGKKPWNAGKTTKSQTA